MRKALEDSKKQADQAAAFKANSEQQLAQAQQQHAHHKKHTDQNHSINSVNEELKKTQAVLPGIIHQHHKQHNEDPEKLRESLLGARQSTQDAFRKSTTTEKKAPWYSVFCCCVKPVDNERKPLLSK